MGGCPSRFAWSLSFTVAGRTVVAQEQNHVGNGAKVEIRQTFAEIVFSDPLIIASTGEHTRLRDIVHNA